MTDEKENILSKLSVLIVDITENQPLDLSFEAIIAELKEVRDLIKNDLN